MIPRGDVILCAGGIDPFSGGRGSGRVGIVTRLATRLAPEDISSRPRAILDSNLRGQLKGERFDVRVCERRPIVNSEVAGRARVRTI
jgi:hypothetical protein